MSDRTRRTIAWIGVALCFTFVTIRQHQTNQRLAASIAADCASTNYARAGLRALAHDLVAEDGDIDASDERTLELVANRFPPKDCR